MTVEEMMLEVYTGSGEMTNYSPFNVDGVVDVNTEGGARLLRLLNSAQRAVVQWRRTGLRSTYFSWRKNFVERFLTRETSTWVASSSTTTDTIYTPMGFPLGKEGSYVVYGGNAYQIIQQTAQYIILDDLATGMEAGQQFTLVDDFVWIPADEWWISLERLAILPARVELAQEKSAGWFVGERRTVGEPTRWYRSGRKIRLDSVSQSVERFVAVVSLGPSVLTTATEEPEVGPAFHHAMCQWALRELLAHAQEMSASREWGNKFQETMITTMNELESDGLLDASGVSVGGI